SQRWPSYHEPNQSRHADWGEGSRDKNRLIVIGLSVASSGAGLFEGETKEALSKQPAPSHKTPPACLPNTATTLLPRMSSTTTQRPPPANRSIAPSTRLVRAKASIS